MMVFQELGVLTLAGDKATCDWNKADTATGGFVIGASDTYTDTHAHTTATLSFSLLITVGDNSVVFVSL